MKTVNVIDSSSLAKYVNREPGWEEVSKGLEEGSMTVELAIKEVANSLWKRVMRKELNGKLGTSVLNDLLELAPFRVEEQKPLYEGAFGIAQSRSISIYDALFIELAIQKSLPLLTSDEKQAKAADSLGVKTVFIP